MEVEAVSNKFLVAYKIETNGELSAKPHLTRRTHSQHCRREEFYVTIRSTCFRIVSFFIAWKTKNM